MITYAIILFCASVLFFGLSIAIYRGRVDLIHDYHQTRVTDRAAYGKAFAKALASIGVAMAISGGSRDSQPVSIIVNSINPPLGVRKTPPYNGFMIGEHPAVPGRAAAA